MELIKVVNIKKSFGPVQVLGGISFSVAKGEVLGLIGPSGSGKSTCLRTINALETIDSGSITVAGTNLNDPDTPIHKIRQKTAMVFQRFELFPHLTALENVALGPRLVAGLSTADANDQAEQLLIDVGLKEHSHKYPMALSGGQRQRVGIARALANKPEVLLCDEPTSALDPELVDEVSEILQKVAASGMTMVVVSHEMQFIKNTCGRCLFLEDGIIAEQGPVPEFFANPKNERLKSFLSKVHT